MWRLEISVKLFKDLLRQPLTDVMVLALAFFRCYCFFGHLAMCFSVRGSGVSSIGWCWGLRLPIVKSLDRLPLAWRPPADVADLGESSRLSYNLKPGSGILLGVNMLLRASSCCLGPNEDVFWGGFFSLPSAICCSKDPTLPSCGGSDTPLPTLSCGIDSYMLRTSIIMAFPLM